MDENKIREMIVSALLNPMPEKINSKEYVSNRKGDGGLDEKKLTAAEKRKKKDIVKDIEKYFKGNKGALHGFATDKAKELAEFNMNEAQSSSNEITIVPEVEIKSLTFLANKVKEIISSLANAGKNIDKIAFEQLNKDLNILLTNINNKIDKISSTGGLSENMLNFKGNINPELVEKVENFIKGVAKHYGYNVGDAYSAIMTILKDGIRKESGLEEGLPKGYWAKKIPGGKMEESYKTLVNKIKKQGESEEASEAIAGAVASYKRKGGGSGPTAKQKAAMAETIMSKLKR